MIQVLVACLAGITFGAGLVVGGMTDANNILAFLDVGGAWDPKLAFVMASALAVYAMGMLVVRQRQAPFFSTTFALPSRKDLDPRLWGGAAIFGVGWGLSGLCPGPSLVLLGAGTMDGIVFAVCMMVGMLVANSALLSLTSQPDGSR